MGIILGINEKDLAELIVEIVNVADKINVVLGKYDDKFSELKSVYDGKSYTELNDYYNTYVRSKFNTVKNNIVSYADDLTALNRKMHEGSKSMANIFNKGTDEINSITKKVTNYIEELKNNVN